MNRAHTLCAVDAFSQGLGMPPVLVNDAPAWGGLSVCQWRSSWLDGFELPENDDFIIAYHSAGSRKVRAACNGPWSRTTSIPGRVSVIPPGRKVEYRIDGEVEFSSVHFPRELVDGLAQNGFVAQPDFRFAFEDEFASSCMKVLLEEAASTQFRFPYVHAVARALIVHLTETYRDGKVPPPPDARQPDEHTARKLDRMLDYIDASLSEHLTLEDMARRVGVSRAHFARRFRDVTGMTPHRYLTLRRVEKARKLLQQSDACLAEIALEVGFSNQAHFSSVFHAVTGVTPSHYRMGDRGTPAA